MTPPLRLVPPTAGQVAADAGAPFVAFFGMDQATVGLATAAVGLGCHVSGAVARVEADRASLLRLAAELTGRGARLGPLLSRALAPVVAWRLRTRALPLDCAYVMGIVNLTSDSFSGDGVGSSVGAAVRRAAALRADGADLIDVGAESARADRPVVDAVAEAAIVGPAVAALVSEGHVVSADTYKRSVARAALAAGAEVINDISGLTHGLGACEEAASAGAAYVLNYSYSVPKRRPDSPPDYRDVVAETVAWMFERVARLRHAGLPDEAIAVDPGIAFGKSHDEDLQVIRRLGEFGSLGLPVLIAHSRKNFIGSVTALAPADRDPETHAATVLAFAAGARIFRVHDPAGTRRALEMAQAIVSAPAGAFAPDGSSWPWRAGASASHMAAAAPDKQAPAGQRW